MFSKPSTSTRIPQPPKIQRIQRRAIHTIDSPLRSKGAAMMASEAQKTVEMAATR